MAVVLVSCMILRDGDGRIPAYVSLNSMLGLKKSSVTRKRLCQQRGVCYSSSLHIKLLHIDNKEFTKGGSQGSRVQHAAAVLFAVALLQLVLLQLMLPSYNNRKFPLLTFTVSSHIRIKYRTHFNHLVTLML